MGVGVSGLASEGTAPDRSFPYVIVAGFASKSGYPIGFLKVHAFCLSLMLMSLFDYRTYTLPARPIGFTFTAANLIYLKEGQNERGEHKPTGIVTLTPDKPVGDVVKLFFEQRIRQVLCGE